jgi:hypothetical protein
MRGAAMIIGRVGENSEVEKKMKTVVVTIDTSIVLVAIEARNSSLH